MAKSAKLSRFSMSDDNSVRAIVADFAGNGPLTDHLFIILVFVGMHALGVIRSTTTGAKVAFQPATSDLPLAVGNRKIRPCVLSDAA